MPFFRSKKSDKPPVVKSTKNTQHPKSDSSKRQSKSTFYSEVTPNGNPAGSPSPSFSGAPAHIKITVEDYDTDTPLCNEWTRRTSRLCRTFEETVKDKDLLALLLQYMYSRDAGFLIKFWLDVDNFTEATYTRIRSHSIEMGLEDDLPPLSPATSLSPVSSGVSSVSASPAAPSSLSSTPSSTLSPPTSPAYSSTQKKSGKDAKKSKRSSTSKFYIEDEAALKFSRLSSPLQESIKQDAVNIYSKYIAKESQYSHSIGLSEEVRNNAISRICSETGEVDALCFQECKQIAQNRIDTEFFPGFLTSTSFRKYQIDLLTSRDLHLLDVLYYEEMLFYFMEYMEQEASSHLLQCWLAVDNFQSQLLASQPEESAPSSSSQAQADAMVIYDKYFSLQASVPLGFSTAVRIQVELNICGEEGTRSDCFLQPKIGLLKTMNENYFGPFMQSQVYFRFLSEILNSVQATQQQEVMPTRTKRSGSLASADSHSVDSHGLGGGGSGSARGSEVDLRHRGAMAAAAVSALGVPQTFPSSAGNSGRLTPVESDDVHGGTAPLWARSQTSMTLGRMSQYGRFLTDVDIEPEGERKKGSMFVRKKKKEQAQEDMAWQVAQMIVSDVQKDVLGGSSLKRSGEG